MTEQKTVRVRIAVAVDQTGDWCAGGHRIKDRPAEFRDFDWILDGIEDGEARYWVEAEVPIPAPPTIQGEVKP